MTRMEAKSLSGAAVVAVALVLGGCASPANRDAMVANQVHVAKKFASSVSVDVKGGGDTSSLGSSNISSADLKAAIEKSISQTGLFRTVVQTPGGDYELGVSVVRLAKPAFGLSFTVDMEAGWTLSKVSDHSVVWRQGIQSSHTASMSDAFVGVERLRIAVEGAARANIAKGLQAIGELNLP